jgi:hypothetical protein
MSPRQCPIGYVGHGFRRFWESNYVEIGWNLWDMLQQEQLPL